MHNRITNIIHSEIDTPLTKDLMMKLAGVEYVVEFNTIKYLGRVDRQMLFEISDGKIISSGMEFSQACIRVQDVRYRNTRCKWWGFMFRGYGFYRNHRIATLLSQSNYTNQPFTDNVLHVVTDSGVKYEYQVERLRVGGNFKEYFRGLNDNERDNVVLNLIRAFRRTKEILKEGSPIPQRRSDIDLVDKNYNNYSGIFRNIGIYLAYMMSNLVLGRIKNFLLMILFSPYFLFLLFLLKINCFLQELELKRISFLEKSFYETFWWNWSGATFDKIQVICPDELKDNDPDFSGNPGVLFSGFDKVELVRNPFFDIVRLITCFSCADFGLDDSSESRKIVNDKIRRYLEMIKEEFIAEFDFLDRKSEVNSFGSARLFCLNMIFMVYLERCFADFLDCLKNGDLKNAFIFSNRFNSFILKLIKE